jgi:hypothetical protein
MVRWVFALAVLALVPACNQQRVTQLVVVVDSDFSVPSELVFVDAEVLDPGGALVSQQSFWVAPPGAGSATRFELPLSFGIVPQGGDATRRAQIVVRGRSAAGTPLVEQTARTGFVAGQSLVLPMFLARRCIGVTCGTGETCTLATCAPDERPPETLDPLPGPGGELRRDAGRIDTGPCGGGDADGDGVPDDCDDWPCGTEPSVPAIVGGGAVVIDQVQLGEGASTAVVPPSTTVRLRFGWRVDDTGCPGCIDQLEIGAVPGDRIYCAFDDNPPPGGIAGFDDRMIPIPPMSGRVDLRFVLGQDFGCFAGGRTGWWLATPPPQENTFAVLCVAP